MLPGMAAAGLIGGRGPSVQKTVFITSTGLSTYTIPADFATLVSIEILAAGIPGSNGNGITGGGGNEGGCYVKATALTGLSAGGSLFCRVGLSTGTRDTWVNNTSSAAPASTSEGILAKAASVTTNCIPSSTAGAFTVFAGGAGGSVGGNTAGSGGGGAAGPDGVGRAGTSSAGGGAGGAGNNSAAGGGAGGTSGGAGTAGTYWTATAGGTAGPGGGGAGGNSSSVGGAGAAYGGGGGGGGATGSKAGGAAGDGIIIFTYLT